MPSPAKHIGSAAGPLGDGRRRAALRTHPGSPISMLTAGDCCLIRPRGAASARVDFPALRRPAPGGERIRRRSSLPLNTSPRHPALFGERRRQQRSLLSGKRLSDNRPLDSAMEYRASELAADRVIHVVGTLAGTAGSAILVGIAAAGAVLPTFSSSLVYSVCLVAMLGCSSAYNLASNPSRREFLRQLDHAAIFLMIAGTYTPFTTCRLHGVWAIGMTIAVWTGAVTGAVMKLICPRRLRASFYRCLPGSGLDNTSGDEAPATFGGPSDGGFDRSWRRALFYRDRLLSLAGAAFPLRNMARLRAGRS